MGIEERFDVGLVARLASDEKQIQQRYRPVIGVHKWFARRPGSLFRALLLAEFTTGGTLREAYLRSHDLDGLTVLDPFMGGGTTLVEANRVGCNVVGLDINPMAWWIVRQELAPLDRGAFRAAADAVVHDVEQRIAPLYQTTCATCARPAPVKYFLWVKQVRCPRCAGHVDLFPGYLVATNERHPRYVLHCPCCRALAELDALPAAPAAVKCPHCAKRFDWTSGSARRNRYRCACGHEGRYPADVRADGPPSHRLFALEYHCAACRPAHDGRWFKAPTAADLARFSRAGALPRDADLPCPDDDIPDGDETRRLHRWGYRRYLEMFNQRQLLALGLLVQRIRAVPDRDARHALATVFSDSLRYQNMLARYDTYALKCQDIFSVHGFPVGLVQCESNPLGIPGVGSGGFRHFVEKYDRAKAYCQDPFETLGARDSRRRIATPGERIEASFVSTPAELRGRRALLRCGSLDDLTLEPGTVDAVLTDPPYFDNVQYAELMDFCFAWLRLLLAGEVEEFTPTSTRSGRELTGNVTSGRNLAHFTDGVSRVFSAAARTLKRGAPFVFTYHHNDVRAYVPVVVGVLDAGLVCTATLPCPAEMAASLHINGTASSVMDTILVCRRARVAPRTLDGPGLTRLLRADAARLAEAGLTCSRGDYHCLALGHLARHAIARLRRGWRRGSAVATKMAVADAALRELASACGLEEVVEGMARRGKRGLRGVRAGALAVAE